MPNNAILEVDGKKAELPVMQATEGPEVIDVTKLYKETDRFTYDPGFMSTASCESKITFIDGDEGILRYRGYNIADLAEKSDYLEVAYLLLYGELPNKEEKGDFENQVTHHTLVHEQLQFLMRGFPRKAHPMAILSGSFASLSAFYHDSLDIRDPHQRELAAVRMIAKIPTLTAWAYKYSIGQPFMYPQNKMGYTERFLYMMFGNPCEEWASNPKITKAVDQLLILHADHEQNASTSTVRLAGSSGANPFACIGAGIASLWGPAHGGANEAVLNMLEEIGDLKNVKPFIEKVKKKEEGVRLMGFGHRVYKNYDPRAKVIRNAMNDVLKEKMSKNRWLISRSSWNGLRFPTNILSAKSSIQMSISIQVLFISFRYSDRNVYSYVCNGKNCWMDFTMERNDRGSIAKIGRPRQLYTGYKQRSFVEVGKRK